MVQHTATDDSHGCPGHKATVSGRNMKVADNFVRGLDVLVSVSRLSPAKAYVIVVYHDCKHQMNTSKKLA